MKVSPDATFLIYTDGIHGLVKLDANTGTYLKSIYAGDSTTN